MLVLSWYVAAVVLNIYVALSILLIPIADGLFFVFAGLWALIATLFG